MEQKDLHLEIAKLIGEPISTKLPVSVEIGSISNYHTAEPGEKIWTFANLDKDADYILDVDANGYITTVKKTLLGDTQLTFKGLNSRLEYVLVDSVLASPDTQILARKKVAITRGMDKREVKIILDAILAGTNVPANQGVQTNDATSGEDLYDVIIQMKHLVEDYGDKFTLLVGTTVKEKIDTYDKDNIATFNYNLSLIQRLKDMGIDEIVKVFGKVDAGSGEVALLNASYAILVAKNSRLTEGKPIEFVRRKINPDIAKLMGADIDSAQRALIVNPVPVMVDVSGTATNLLAYGIYGYESFIFAITNPLAICESDMSLAIA